MLMYTLNARTPVRPSSYFTIANSMENTSDACERSPEHNNHKHVRMCISNIFLKMEVDRFESVMAFWFSALYIEHVRVCVKKYVRNM